MKTSGELRREGLFRTADAVELIELVEQQHRDLERNYNELIMAVARKLPGETRHATALRYICEAEIAATKNYARIGSLLEAPLSRQCLETLDRIDRETTVLGYEKETPHPTA